MIMKNKNVINKKTERLYIRVSPIEKKLIKKLSFKAGYDSMASFILDRVFYGSQPVIHEDPRAYLQVINQVKRIGVNINQIAKKLNTYYDVTPDDIENIDALYEMLNTVNESLSSFVKERAFYIDHPKDLLQELQTYHENEDDI